MGKWYEPAKDKIQRCTIIDENGCWIWTNSIHRNGYGRIWMHGKEYLPHRVAYEEFIGPIPEGLDIDHLCRVRICCNPKHLEPATRQVNIQRGWDAGRQHHAKQ